MKLPRVELLNIWIVIVILNIDRKLQPSLNGEIVSDKCKTVDYANGSFGRNAFRG